MLYRALARLSMAPSIASLTSRMFCNSLRRASSRASCFCEDVSLLLDCTFFAGCCGCCCGFDSNGEAHRSSFTSDWPADRCCLPIEGGLPGGAIVLGVDWSRMRIFGSRSAQSENVAWRGKHRVKWIYQPLNFQLNLTARSR